jgi:hypothetical protein
LRAKPASRPDCGHAQQFPFLPLQLRAKWAALYQSLVRTPQGCLTAGDRAALLVVGDLGTVATAIYKSCVACTYSEECPEPASLLAEVGISVTGLFCDGSLCHQRLPKPASLVCLVDPDTLMSFMLFYNCVLPRMVLWGLYQLHAPTCREFTVKTLSAAG